MISYLKILTSLLLGSSLSVYGKPLETEEILDSILPEVPRTTNETLEAIVQDPVVKNAVQYAIGDNNTLSGLIIKRKTVIIPINDPSKTPSQVVQIWKVPDEHLEDVRKNLTDDVEEVDIERSEITLSFVENENDPEESPLKNKRESNSLSVEVATQEVSTRNSVLLDGTITEKLSKIIGEEAALSVQVPIVAVLDPSRKANDQAERTIMALLPIAVSDSGSGSGLPVTTQKQLSYGETVPTISEAAGSSDALGYRRMKKSLIIPALGVPGDFHRTVIRSAKSSEDPEDLEDLDVAEDIIFRPLFRIRQQAERKSNYYNSYRRRYSPYYRSRRPYYNRYSEYSDNYD